MTHLQSILTSKHSDSGYWLSLAEHRRPLWRGKSFLTVPWQQKISMKGAVNPDPLPTSHFLHPLRNTPLLVNRTVQEHSPHQGIPSSTSMQRPSLAMKQTRCCRIPSCKCHPRGCPTRTYTEWLSPTDMPNFQAQWRIPTQMRCSIYHSSQRSHPIHQFKPYQPIEQAPAFEDDVWYDDFSQGFPAAPIYQHPSFPVPTSMAPMQSHETIDLTQDTDDFVPTSPVQKRKRSNDDIGKETSSFKKQALAFQPPSHPPGPPPPPPLNPNRRRQLKGHRHIQGFPPASSPLPPNIEFCDILYEYPNHIHGELLLRMNREGGYTVRMMRETSKCLVPPNPKDKGNPKGVYVLEEKELKNRLANARPRLDPEGKGSKRKRKSSDEDDKSHDDAKVYGALVESAAKRAKVDDEGTADATSRISSAGNAQYPTPPKTVPSSPIVATFPQSPSKLSAPAPAPVPTLAAPAATKMTSNSCLALQNRMHDFLHDHFHDHMLEIDLNKSYKKKTNTYTNDIHKYAEEMIERREKIAKGRGCRGG